MSDPEKILVAGDWHGNRRWAMDVIMNSRRLLEDEEQRIIVHLGDFGFWPYKAKEWLSGDTKPEALRYQMDVQSVLELAGAHILVTPGNHDDYDAMERWAEDEDDYLFGGFCPQTPFGKLDRIHVLPRGARWTWHERTWLSVGGAVSVDRLLPPPPRIAHETWWPQEEVTAEQEAAIIGGGKADVMVCHDSPSWVPILPEDHHMQPYFAPEDLDRSRAHSNRMQRIVNAVQPRWYLHGHHHIRYQSRFDWGWDRMFRIDGMGKDGDPGNFGVLNVRTMEWIS